MAKMAKIEKIITVKVIPRARKSEILGWEGNVLKVRLKANPEKGKANEELIALLSELFHLAKSKIQLIRGHKSRLKQVRLEE